MLIRILVHGLLGIIFLGNAIYFAETRETASFMNFIISMIWFATI